MVVLKPFKGVRPTDGLVQKVASPPYDVLSSEEAREKVKGNPYSLLRIIKPEVDFPSGTDEHSKQVYEKAVENYRMFKDNGWIVKEERECFYIYAQTMDGRTQYGIVGCAGVDDYLNDRIKKHELTRNDKEADRMKHVRNTNANIEPVFLSYSAVKELDELVSSVVSGNKPVYDFVADDGFGHKFWVVDDDTMIGEISKLFNKIPHIYVADGHHRTAAAALVGEERRSGNDRHTGDERYNFFLAVLFPDNQLQIIDYNRVVKDLNGMSEQAFLTKLKENFLIEKTSKEACKPDSLHTFGMYLGGNWYKLVVKSGRYNDDDPIGSLDVTILSNLILDKLLGIRNLRTDKRVDFIGGIRGLGELERRVDSGDMKVAFALYPTSMKQLTDIADSGSIMPPKTTWFEPKLRSGLIIHELSD